MPVHFSKSRPEILAQYRKPLLWPKQGKQVVSLKNKARIEHKFSVWANVYTGVGPFSHLVKNIRR